MSPGLGLHQTGRHRYVVEHTKATALVRIGVVRAPRQVARHPLGQGIAGGGHRGPHRTAGPLGHSQTPRETDFALHRRIETAGGHTLDISGRVYQRQLTVARGRGLAHDHGRKLLRQTVAQSAVFAHRKAVTFGQGQNKVVGVVSVHVLILGKAILENPL